MDSAADALVMLSRIVGISARQGMGDISTSLNNWPHPTSRSFPSSTTPPLLNGGGEFGTPTTSSTEVILDNVNIRKELTEM